MIRLGFRLTLGGGRDAAARLVMIAIAVALGVALLLTTLAGINAVNTPNTRSAWLYSGPTISTARSSAASTSPPPGQAHPSHLASRTCQARASSMLRLHSAGS
jgi:hypothetical protein